MTHILKGYGRRLINKTFKHSARLNSVKAVSRIMDIDLLEAAYADMGILQWQNLSLSGEQHVMKEVVAKFKRKPDAIIFDVGANCGEYTQELRSTLPHASIYSFEPNPITFRQLEANVEHSEVRCVNKGLSKTTERVSFFTNRDMPETSHASLYREVLDDIHEYKGIDEIQVDLITLDEFCTTNKIESIDFLKIDTEGNELAVLQGASAMLSQQRIRAIQFEFNSMNVISRVFLRDFFEILKGYRIYRLHQDGLKHIENYHHRLEIFEFQNFLALTEECRSFLNVVKH